MAGDRKLERLYELAIYRLELPPGPVAVQVGRHSSLVDEWFSASGIERGAYLTAANPRSKRLDLRSNQLRHERLRERVQNLEIRHLPAESSDPDGHWRESGLLLVAIAESEALGLAREFDQAAILVLERGRPPRLVWT